MVSLLFDLFRQSVVARRNHYRDMKTPYFRREDVVTARTSNTCFRLPPLSTSNSPQRMVKYNDMIVENRSGQGYSYRMFAPFAS